MSALTNSNFNFTGQKSVYHGKVRDVHHLENNLLIISVSLVLAGAIGNLIDSIFYGYLFTDSYLSIALFSPGSGYESLLYGHVVDMLQFPMFTWEWPNWIPFFGGESFTFFEPVFNVADTAISTGVGIMIVFNKRIFP